MNPRYLSTVDGEIAVTPTGALTQVTYLYKLGAAPPLQVSHRTWFRPDTAEVTVHQGETTEVVLSGPRVTSKGKPLGPTIQRPAICYQEHHTPWDHLPVWAEGLLHLHESILEYQLIRPAVPA